MLITIDTDTALVTLYKRAVGETQRPQGKRLRPKTHKTAPPPLRTPHPIPTKLVPALPQLIGLTLTRLHILPQQRRLSNVALSRGAVISRTQIRQPRRTQLCLLIQIINHYDNATFPSDFCQKTKVRRKNTPRKPPTKSKRTKPKR